MKIAVWHHLPSGGGKRALFSHMKGLGARGHTVEVWSPPAVQPAYLSLDGLARQHIVPFNYASTRPRGRLGIYLAPIYETLDALSAQADHCRRCAQEISAGGFDILFANSSVPFAVSPIGRFTRIPKVLYLQEPFRKLYEAAPQLPWLAMAKPQRSIWSPKYLRAAAADWVRTQGLRIQAREELLNARAFDTILVNSLYSRESVLRAYGLDSQVCYLGVDTELFANRGLRREDLVVGMGSFVPAKNVEIAIRAVAQLPDPRPPLVWICNAVFDWYLTQMQSLATSLRVELTIQAGIADAEIVDLLNRAQLMICAPRLEPFGLAPLEANACGVPVVAVAEGGIRETVVNEVNGLLVDNDPAAVAEAIRRLRDKPAFARSLGEDGCRIVREKWSLAGATDRLEFRLQRALCRRPSQQDSEF